MKEFHHKTVVKAQNSLACGGLPQTIIRFTILFVPCFGGNAARRAAIFFGCKNLSVREKAKKNTALPSSSPKS